MAETTLAWLWAPIVLYGLALGVALLAERALRVRLPNALLPPVGVALLVALVMPVYHLGLGAPAALALTIPCALAGFLLARSSLRTRLNPGAAGLAALAAYGLYMAPVALSGHWTWPGYNFVNDTAANFIFADLLLHDGISAPAAPDSGTETVAAGAGQLGYPLGAHGLLATVTPLTGASLAAVYHPLIAAFAALGAMSLTELARRSGLPPAAAALAGFVGIAAALLYRYGLHGAVKEVLVLTVLATGAALGREALDRDLDWRVVVLIAVCGASLVHVFSAVGAAYALVLGVGLVVAALVERRRPAVVARMAAVGAAVALVVAVVTLSDAATFGKHAGDAFASEGGSSTAYIGHLARPLPAVQASGVWIARDYRQPASLNESENAVLVAIALLLALAGLVFDLSRRRAAMTLLFVPAAAVAAGLAPLLSPYADAKLLVVLTPAVALLACGGGVALIRRRHGLVRAVGALATVGLVVGVLWSDAFGYREATLAPADRVDAMIDAAEHARGGGLWLVNEWEEYAKYFMRSIRVNPAFEAEAPRPVALTVSKPIFGNYFDLDIETVDYVTGFPGIIKRRSPDASRPPASFEMTYRNDYYEVWRRRRGVEVRQHLPLQGLHQAARRPDCGAVRQLGANAGPGESIVAARRPPVPRLDVLKSERSESWVRSEEASGTVTPVSPGFARGPVVTAGGRHRVWVRGTFGRPVTAWVDGRRVGAVEDVNTPGQWLQAATVDLRAGRHRLEVRRGRRSLAPADAYRGIIGPMALEPVGGQRLVRVPPSRAILLCGREWDWIERVRGR